MVILLPKLIHTKIQIYLDLVKIDISNEGLTIMGQKLQFLILNIYKSNIEFVGYKGKQYQELPNTWGGVEDPEDPNLGCDDYDTCNLELPFEAESPDFDEINYNICMPKLDKDCQCCNGHILGEVDCGCESDDHEKMDKENTCRCCKHQGHFCSIHLSERILSDEIVCSNKRYDKVFLTGPRGYTVNLTKKSRFNNDHRGSTHCRLDLPYTDGILLSFPIKLQDLIDSLYHMKSHKFDKWYELYCGCDVEISEEDKEITINLRFDNGS